MLQGLEYVSKQYVKLIDVTQQWQLLLWLVNNTVCVLIIFKITSIFISTLALSIHT